MSSNNKVSIFILYFFFSISIAFAQGSGNRDLSPPWYKRFAGNIGNETGLIHIQKSYRYAIIVIQTPTLNISFQDPQIVFDSDKIEANTTRMSENKEEKWAFRGEINTTTLTGIITTSSGQAFGLGLEENYTGATEVKLYEYSYVDQGSYQTLIDVVHYFYHYGLFVVPKYELKNFQANLFKSGLFSRCYDGLKGEIPALQNPDTRYLTDESYSRVVYNQNDMLILEKAFYTYEGGRTWYAW